MSDVANKDTRPERTESQTRALCLNYAVEMVDSLRVSNLAFTQRTGKPSTVSEADYMQAQDEIERALLRAAGLKPRHG